MSLNNRPYVAFCRPYVVLELDLTQYFPMTNNKIFLL